MRTLAHGIRDEIIEPKWRRVDGWRYLLTPGLLFYAYHSITDYL